ncbi:MAG: SCO family protein [Bacteroidetes bacterium]|nr:SCO family protein [Bacteroidota bacterium]
MKYVVINYRAVLLLPLVAVLSLVGCQPQQDGIEITELPEIKQAPSFSSTNYDGSTVTDADLAGSVYIAYFFFTSCGGPCPIMNSTANVLQAEYAREDDFRIVGFTVDPETDTVTRLSQYADRYSARPGKWSMLRNEVDVVGELTMKGFLMGSAEEPVMHSTRFALVDRRGVIRGYFDGLDDEKVRELRAAINFLLGERS